MSGVGVMRTSPTTSATGGSRRKSNGLSGKSDNISDAIRVVCRFRPPKQSEIDHYGQSSSFEHFKISEETGTVDVQSDLAERKSFTFDKVLTSS